jgi:NADPH:quinone reductase-like Zn-dependent oxidoreductase
MKPVIDGHYTLDEIQKAFEYYLTENQKGKIVITIHEK